jgi:serine/threonine-protein kinase
VTPRRGSVTTRPPRHDAKPLDARSAWTAVSDERDTPGSGQRTARPTALAPGAVIGNRYELVSILDRGGVGTIWSARDSVGACDVALKVVASGDARIDGRFRREVAIGREIAGAHFVPLRDFGAEPQFAWFVMELLRGEDLATRLDRLGALPRDVVVRVARDLATALDAAHAAGLVHRDLKPKNIFMALDASGQETLKVLDFGAAKQVFTASKLTATGVLLGSPHYMSPEQIESGSEVDHRTDLWSMAAILYRALVGRRPFDGELATLLVRVRTEEAPPPSAIDSTLPGDVDGVFEQALAKDPCRRFRTAAALAQAFATSLEA